MGDALTRLAGRLGGELLPDEPGYDDARRGYNRLHDRRPAVIVRPAGADDIARALEFATSAPALRSRSAAGVTAWPAMAPARATC
jgi:hypothetical protein